MCLPRLTASPPGTRGVMAGWRRGAHPRAGTKFSLRLALTAWEYFERLRKEAKVAAERIALGKRSSNALGTSFEKEIRPANSRNFRGR